MKQFKIILAISFFLSLSVIEAYADFDRFTKVEVGSLYYYLDNDNSLAELTYNKFWDGSYKGDIDIPSSFDYNNKRYNVTNIGVYAFYKCSDLTSINIPNSLTDIGDGAFAYCTSITSIYIPESVTTIGNYVFEGCSALSSIVVNEDNKVYDSRDNCNAIIISETNEMLRGCQNTIIPNGVITISSAAFLYCTGLKYLSLPESVTSIGIAAFKGCSDLANIIIPSSVTSIGSEAFEGCTSLSSVKIPDGVTTIEDYTFKNCNNLVSIEMPNSVNSIGIWAFSECTSLSSITIPNSIKTIGAYLFYDCSNLSYVNIPKSVTFIGDYAFAGCNQLFTIISKIENPCFINYQCFDYNVYNNATLYVPDGTTDIYKSTDYWSRFVHIEEEAPSGINTINRAEDGSSPELDRFDVRGNRLKTPQKGLNIIRMSDGSKKKVMIK